MDELEKDLTQGDKPTENGEAEGESVLGSLFKAWSSASTDEVKPAEEKAAETVSDTEAKAAETVQEAKETVANEVKETAEEARPLFSIPKPVLTEEPEEEPKKPNLKLIGIIGGVAALLVIILLVILLQKPTINLNDYTTISFDGYEGFGNAVVTIDYTKLQEDYGKKIKISTSKSSNDLEAAFSSLLSSYVTVDYVVKSCASYNVLPNNNLKNGDEVVLTWNINEESFEAATNGKIKASEMKAKAEGLQAIAIFDPFEGLEYKLDGYSGEGVLTFTAPSSSPVSALRYNVDYAYELTNGEKITFTVSTSRNSDFVAYCQQNGYMPSSTTKEITVSGLKEYVDADLFSDVKISFTGASGLGKLEINTDNVTIENIRYYSDKTDNLSNGDKVVVYVDSTGWSGLESTLKSQGYILKESQKEFTVSDLEEVDGYDPFSEADIEYDGISSEATAKMIPGDSKMGQYFSYSIDKSYNLSNGDEIVVTPRLASGSIQDFVDKFGKMPVLEAKKYTVEGLPHYYEDGDEVPDSVLEEMQKQCEDIFVSYDANDTEYEESEYLGNIILMNKNSNGNYIYLVYKNTYSFKYDVPSDDEDDKKDDKKDDKDKDTYETYEVVRFNNLLVDEAGEGQIDVMNYWSNPGSKQWTLEHEAGNSWGGTYSDWAISGYESIDDVKADVINKNRESYFYIDNVDEK